ncbi:MULTISPECIES: NAD-glutamate dehydrogenase [Thalassospira]|jgi:glutamate dehydrogenase|uniref:NAD-glutamate dehydrogenase n=1 Tax=Thalassospira xiamenensis TaxID=220697 RepID=A0ABR5Y660_9PROT|nr:MULTISPECIES: NAD-glutamate dehydrogenase [Thalassospira]KZD06600.1 NAD-glutamate dehydrogenase [Thalassospira xiamenensis]KZD10803.1 NAD-glutamate dehydrogenase [Thalassospira xiamenensis]MAB32387.1 NAD-glutamate dehydrogenase [Thalassospira sp.]MBL4840028.1 NAD-glutamate dehydrogenase [Thalassospira sp.]MCD1592705.1 NAD-glutamate dehydrogenase [Thalassospira xiamenensis]|tara:strand:- start:3107 stop:7942 length:4836 start_codon:yes stop_codon:yes gene_type:complete
MKARSDDPKREVIDKVVEQIQQRLTGKMAKDAEAFVRLFYKDVPPDDMAGRSVDSLYGAALTLYKFAQKRPSANAAKIRVYNPDLEEHGWKSDHTVIEMINTDMPFLVDSVTSALNEFDLTVHLVIHPIMRIARDDRGELQSVEAVENSDASRESVMHLEIDEQTDEAVLRKIRDRLEDVLTDVSLSVEDWQAMLSKVAEVLDGIRTAPTGISAEDQKEAQDFLGWVHNDHFTFLGYREYKFSGTGKKAKVDVNPQSQLGILRREGTHIFDELRQIGNLSTEVQAFVAQPSLLMVTKANKQSTVHRSVHLDTIVVKQFDDEGKVVGQHLFVGLFTSVAYNLSPRLIPLLRMKLAETIKRAGFPPASHDAKALVNILETFPRDELFQIELDDLYHICMGILHLQERQRIALFVRRDAFERFVSCQVFCPRDRFSTKLRMKFQSVIEAAFDGKVTAHYTLIGDSPLARLHLLVKTTPGELPEYNVTDIERQLVETARDWADTLRQVLVREMGEERGLTLYRRYGESFTGDYRDRFGVDTAALDIDRIEDVIKSSDLRVNLYRPIEAAENELRFKIYNPGAPVPLSDVLPMLENMGLKVITENPFKVEPRDTDVNVRIHDFGVLVDGEFHLHDVRDKFQELFIRMWHGEVENDAFNRLVLLGGLHWREVVILRTYARYMRQMGSAFSQDYMAKTLANNAGLAATIVDLFVARFDPDRDPGLAAEAEAIEGDIITRLEDVMNPDEDRILRAFLNLVQSTLRTNYFQYGKDGNPKPYLSVKFNSGMVEDLPLPRPWREIFVYSPRVEAVHLRGGPVARGGIRWSDRQEDFRTEILGLVKAQMVKNAVIVPVGSKGGFVVKRPPVDGGREAFLEEGIACYKTLMSGMLDITDNIVGGDIIPPERVRRLDDDDPYLVVAADKGTATFSDIANGVARDYGFWLDDAFASGGSQGYDHKKMGITARGAWESVKRHFREIGKDIQKEPFTVAGVGDMSGDVFGNGMLLSEQIKLVAAFNHMHIFVDPDPDLAKSFAERKRLFDMPRSSWADYDTKVLSKGGAIFDRKAKTLDPSAEVRKLLDLGTGKVTPADMMKAILKADVELLWFGGIGTYIKSSAESNADAGDRANDSIRINGKDIRAKVIGEGANLGCTQRGRIEYAHAGGRLNTDAIDNAAGVNCSDHEVNIKILVGEVVAAGDMTEKQRNKLLVEMTDEVGDLVLRDNYLQSQAISNAFAGGGDALDAQVRLIRMLEREGRLNREIEYLPDDEELARRTAAHQGLTRPEISVLMPYAKLWLYDEVLKSDLPDDPILVEELVRYFPTAVRKKYSAAISSHRLKREIIATVGTNSLVNRVGGTFVHDMMEATGLSAVDVSRGYLITRAVFGLRKLWAGIEALDNKVDAKVQIAMFSHINRMVEDVTLWFLRNCEELNVGAKIELFRPAVAKVIEAFDDIVPADAAFRTTLDQKSQSLIDRGVPEDLARRIAAMQQMVAVCDIVRIAEATGRDVIDVGATYFAIGARFQLGLLRAAAESIEAETHWQKLARAAAIDDLFGHQRELTRVVLSSGTNGTVGGDLVRKWVDDHQRGCARCDQLIDELRAAGQIDLSMITVANRQIRAMVGG